MSKSVHLFVLNPLRKRIALTDDKMKMLCHFINLLQKSETFFSENISVQQMDEKKKLLQ